MVLGVPGQRSLTEEELNLLFMLGLKDDTEDAPWMVMGSLQWSATSEFFQGLRAYVVRHGLPWFVTGMTPILFTWPGLPGKRQLAPDVFVAFVPDRPRSSYDLEVEGAFPQFVLEVVSPSSAYRDQGEKRLAYELLKAREYALFTPRVDRPSELEGYRLSDAGRFEPWGRDDQGRLWSEVLGLYLVVQGTTIRAATREGELLPTLTEALAARERETAALRESETEIARLRREIEDLRRQAQAESSDPSDPAS